MASVVQFVDSIASSPTVRLDLNSLTANGLAVDVAGIDLSPPPMRRAISSTMLVDGDNITAAAFENRIVKLTVRVVYPTTTDAVATTVQNLARELNRPTNILKVQLNGATSPVFFRTFRAPDFTLGMLRLLFNANTSAALEIPAEPFALGLRENPVVLATLNVNPAVGNLFVDVTGVKGDVEAPAYIRWPAVGSVQGSDSVFGVRRRGTPSGAPFLFQAEAMTQFTDTATQANDANFSGAGNNYSRTTFATNATMQTRLFVSDMGTASVDLRGRYRVFLRYRKNTPVDVINLQLQWGSSLVFVTNTAFSTPNNSDIQGADLGEISLPVGVDPVTSPDGVEVVVSDVTTLRLQAERVSGGGTIDFDFLLLVPADDRFGILRWNDTTTSYWLLDSRDNSASARDSSDRIYGQATPSIVGGLPMLSPNQTNRIYMLPNVRPNWTLTPTITNVSVSYWPRYLSVRPAAT